MRNDRRALPGWRVVSRIIETEGRMFRRANRWPVEAAGAVASATMMNRVVLLHGCW